MNLLSCCMPWLGSPRVAPSEEIRTSRKYQIITSSGPIATIPEALYYSLFTFAGCSHNLNYVCASWNRIYKDFLNSPSSQFSFQFFQYKSLCQEIPLFKAILNITEKPSTLALFRDKILSPAVQGSHADVKLTRIEITGKTTEEELLNRSFEMICKDRLEQIEASFELIRKVLLILETERTYPLKSHRSIPKLATQIKLIQNLNTISFFHGVKLRSLEDDGTDIRYDLEFIIGLVGIKKAAESIKKGFNTKKGLETSAIYTAVRVQGLITEIPSIIDFYVNIEQLNLSNHKILFLPEFKTLTRLRVLNLAHNLLTEIPINVVRSLVKLQILHLEHNLIHTFPVELQGLKELTVVSLFNNPFIEATMLTNKRPLFGEHITCLLTTPTDIKVR